MIRSFKDSATAAIFRGEFVKNNAAPFCSQRGAEVSALEPRGGCSGKAPYSPVVEGGILALMTGTA